LRQTKTAKARSRRLVNQRSAQRNEKATAHDRRAIARAIRIHIFAPSTIAIRASQARRRSTVNAEETLARSILANYNNQLQSSTIDLTAHVESLLQNLGATTSDSGGKVTYYGSDPITPDRLPYGAISAISLAAKAILIAKIWKERTGEGQDIHVDVRKALRRLTPFLDGKWELVNGFPGRTDPYSPFASGGPDIVPTRDGKWIMLADVFPALRQHALDLLKPKGGYYEAVRDAVKEWNGEELEEAGEKAGIPCRSPATSKTC
jgi:hypothetical protein